MLKESMLEGGVKDETVRILEEEEVVHVLL